MPSERVQRQIDQLLDEAERAIRDSDWPLVRSRCEQVLALDPGNLDASHYLASAERGLVAERGIPGRQGTAVEAGLKPARSDTDAGEMSAPPDLASGPFPSGEVEPACSVGEGPVPSGAARPQDPARPEP